jgi:hypothetical protein
MSLVAQPLPSCEAPFVGRGQSDCSKTGAVAQRRRAARPSQANKGAAEKPVIIRSWQTDHQRFHASPLSSNANRRDAGIADTVRGVLQAGERLKAGPSLRI